MYMQRLSIPFSLRSSSQNGGSLFYLNCIRHSPAQRNGTGWKCSPSRTRTLKLYYNVKSRRLADLPVTYFKMRQKRIGIYLDYSLGVNA